MNSRCNSVVFKKNKQHEEARAQTGWLRIRIMCGSGATCLPMHYKNPIKHVDLVQSRCHRHLKEI